MTAAEHVDLFEDKAIAALAGAAVGDALGGAAEGNSPEAIRARYGGPIEGIVGPFNPDWRTARPIAPYHKGDGHITDDTLLTLALVEVYDEVRRHLTAFDVADHLVPRLIGERRWIPELETETILLQRLFLAEKWLVARLHYGHVDPREAGVGNIVNCGAAMIMPPVGVVNAGDPGTAYAEGIDLSGAHQSSYGREAAGVFAAAVAEAMRPGARVEDVVDTALRLAKDGTHDAIDAVATVAARHRDPLGAIDAIRDAVRPFDTVGDAYRTPARDARLPNRTKSIEELPVALGMLLAASGDHRAAVLGAVNYGRDSDSIAVMAGAIAGALGGRRSVDADWVQRIGDASRLDLERPGRTMAAVARDVWAADDERAAARTAARRDLAASALTAAP